MKEKLEKLGLPVEWAESNFASVLPLIDEKWASKVQEYFNFYGFEINRASELKYFTHNEEGIKVILARLQYCKEHNIPMVDENGNNKKEIFINGLWSKMYPEVDLSGITPDVFRDKETINNQTYKNLDSDVNVGLTEETYERYITIDSLLTQVLELLLNLGYDINVNNEVYNSISKLVSLKDPLTDEEILFNALVYKQNRNEDEIAIITNAIKAVADSQREEQMNR